MKQASHLLKYDSTLGTFNADVECAPPLHDAAVLAGVNTHAEPCIHERRESGRELYLLLTCARVER